MKANRRSGRALSWLSLFLILFLTLQPGSGDPFGKMDFWCIFCGERGLADAILNAGLFFPFGVGVALLRGVRFAWAASAVLSGSIELSQLWLPGRFPVLGDLVFNIAGAALGAGFVRGVPTLLERARAPTRSSLFALFLAPALVLGITASLFSPRLPDGVYHGQWTRELGHLGAYGGRVLSAWIGEHPLPDELIPNQDAVKAALREREAIRFTVVAGPQSHEPAHLLAVYDDRQREVLLFWVQRGEDLLFRKGTLSGVLRLDQPALRGPGAIQATEGDTLAFEVLADPTRLCRVSGGEGECTLAPGVEAGWQLLVDIPALPTVPRRLLGFLWLAALGLPMGFLAGSLRRSVLLGILLGGVAAGLSWWSPDLSPHLVTLLSPSFGAAGGWLLRAPFLRVRRVIGPGDVELDVDRPRGGEDRRDA